MLRERTDFESMLSYLVFLLANANSSPLQRGRPLPGSHLSGLLGRLFSQGGDLQWQFGPLQEVSDAPRVQPFLWVMGHRVAGHV